MISSEPYRPDIDLRSYFLEKHGRLPKVLPPQFSEDLSTFLHIKDQLTGQVVEGDTPPEGSVYLGNVFKDPFSSGFLLNATLKNLGYGVHFIDNATGRWGNRLGNNLAVYTDLPDVEKVKQVSRESHRHSRDFDRLVRRTLPGYVFSFLLNPHTSAQLIEYRRIRQTTEGFSSKRFRTELPRALMTSVLTKIVHRQIPFSSNAGDAWQNQEDDIAHYEELSDLGIKSYSFDELKGSVEGIVKKANKQFQ